ncbi:hypothetical protein INT47_004574 [Mucor saturninus]|uniref:Zn(2)-C6 fungal-type domain-containing protein n=1 Tax=Mucor saturninus TaxID=64648 RepID=A0A8H7RKG6_9FUNG|nr:hypothetical protein INT47_004574 [Mucor saturninus]
MPSKRKISCLPCRIKKVKCDGDKPCQRCILKKADCIYQRPGAVGRPPKNAVVNKLVLTKSNQTNFCREFIIENVSISPVLTCSRYLRDSKSIDLSHYLDNIFCAHFKRAATIDSSIQQLEYSNVSPKIQVYDMTHYYTWMGADTANILMRRMSRMKLTYYTELEFTTTAMAYDSTASFFESPADNSLVINPLNSLPPQQAVRLIESFFCIHSHCCMFSKTMLLQSYWTDTADPLLLSVIYGTTLFKSQLLDGKPLILWDALNKKKRNPFLDYAYLLLSKYTAEATVSRYQALVLLALFEVTFGFPKRGISLFHVSNLIAARLGLFDNSMPAGLTEVEKELLLMTFWSAYQCTIRGCVELEKIPREALARHQHSYPPVNIKKSKSYQYDSENNNTKPVKTYYYMIETFYIKSVISKFSCKLILQLPQHNKDAIDKDTPPSNKKWFNTKAGIDAILQEFKEFNQKNHHTFSILQDYTLEMYRLFYTICLGFKRTMLDNKNFTLHQRHIPEPLDLTDVENILAISHVVSDAITVIQRTFVYLSDPSCLHEENCMFLPRGIMVSAIDASVQVLMYSYRLERSEQIRYYLDMALTLLGVDIIWGDWGTAELLKRAIQKFLFQNPPTVVVPENIFSSSFDWMTSLLQPQQNYMNSPWLPADEPWIQDINNILFPPSPISASSCIGPPDIQNDNTQNDLDALFNNLF